MNLRILKKLSKRAAPYLPLLGDKRAQFPAEPGENYHGAVISARKHWERSDCHPTYAAWEGSAEIVYNTRAGNRIVMRPPSHPWSGTIMVGEVSGYYEPEWSEECAWLALVQLVIWHFADYDGEDLVPTRRLRTPSAIFKGAPGARLVFDVEVKIGGQAQPRVTQIDLLMNPYGLRCTWLQAGRLIEYLKGAGVNSWLPNTKQEEAEAA